MKCIAFALGIFAASLSTPGHAFSFRCENDLALVHQDSKATVLQKCGQPFYAEAFCVPLDSDYPVIYFTPNMPFVPFVPCKFFEDWYYNPGSGQLITILRFEATTILQSIRYGPRIP